jgi:regulator of protease activity HflC (stomatin/prohibitin superfamily)
MRGLQAELQARLDVLKSGIEIMAVVVEGIHPPSKAAASYHAVQAAAIESRTKVNTARAEAVRVMKMAALVANSTRNDAVSGAAERLSRGRVDSIQFAGERQAHAVGGPSFVLERQLGRVARGLSDKPLIIMDHRIPAGSVPGIDMRQVRSPRSSFGDPAAD